MEEEGARRRAYNGPGGAGVRGFLQGLNEDEEEEDEDGETLAEARRRQQAADDARRQGVNIAGTGAHGATGSAARVHARTSKPRDTREHHERLNEGRAGPRDQANRGAKGFALDLDGATLLGRRHRKPGGTVTTGVGPSPLARNAIRQADEGAYLGPGSPMHIG